MEQLKILVWVEMVEFEHLDVVYQSECLQYEALELADEEEIEEEHALKFKLNQSVNCLLFFPLSFVLYYFKKILLL